MKMMVKIPLGVCSCYFCGEQLSWKADVDFTDLGIVGGEGMLVSLECQTCGAECAFITKIPEGNEYSIQYENWLAGVHDV